MKHLKLYEAFNSLPPGVEVATPGIYLDFIDTSLANPNQPNPITDFSKEEQEKIMMLGELIGKTVYDDGKEIPVSHTAKIVFRKNTTYRNNLHYGLTLINIDPGNPAGKPTRYLATTLDALLPLTLDLAQPIIKWDQIK